MDLSSHGRKRSSQDVPHSTNRGEGEQREGKKMFLEKGSEKNEDRRERSIEGKVTAIPEDSESYKINPEVFTGSQPFPFVPPIVQHRFHPPIPCFPRPYDLPMNIHGMMRPETTPSQQMQYLRTVRASQFPSSSANVTQMYGTRLSSQKEDLAALSFPKHAKSATSSITSPLKASLSPETIPDSKQASMSTNFQQSSPPHRTHFHKGSLIQLASGQMKKVEDLETEDFISSARSNQDVTLDHSTLVKIETDVAPGCVALTFSVGKSNLMVMMIHLLTP